ncbi:MAG: tol-pal system YbgF family protein [Fidelibacterota bacterium]
MNRPVAIPLLSGALLILCTLTGVLTGQSSSGSPGPLGDDIFFLDLGIVIEPGTGKEEVNRLVKAPPEKVKFFLDKEPSGSVYMASTRELHETLARISDRIDALEESFHREITAVRVENGELREMVADLLAREPILPSQPAVTPVPSLSTPPVSREEQPEPEVEEKVVVTAPAADGSFSKMRYMNAVFAYQREDYRVALDHFSRLYLKEQDHTTRGNVLYWIADCYYQLGDYRRALDTLEEIRSLGRSDKQDDALVLTGLAYRQMGRENEALEAFDHILQYYPDSEYFRLARMELRKSQE